jgi:DnaK suppressor protein
VVVTPASGDDDRAEPSASSSLETLRRRREELQRALSALSGDLPSEAGATVPFGKRAGDYTALATMRAEASRTRVDLERALAAVDAALGRALAGETGRCQRCGGAIEPERLEALPEASLCARCALDDGPRPLLGR